MATGYSSEWSASNSGMSTMYLRLRYSTSYNAASNTSTVTVIPQIKSAGSNTGAYWLYNRNSNSSAGVWGNGIKLFTLDSSYGGSNKNLHNSSVQTSWDDFDPINGSISSFTVQHDSSGVARFTLGVAGSIRSQYYSNYIDNAGGKTSDIITITQAAPYSITYNANGGSGAPNSQSVYAGVSYDVSDIVPVRTGYTFLGWSTNSSATTAMYQPGDSIVPSGNVVLYAVWKLNTYLLNISQGTGSAVSVLRRGEPLSNGAIISYGDVLTVSVSPSIGYNVSGLEVNGSSFISGSTYTVTGAVTVTSTASVKQFTISITEGTGTLVTVVRIYSPLGGAALGELSDGDTIYHSDVLSITVSTTAGYILQEVTMNGGSIQTPYSVSMDVVIVATAIATGAYIKGGSTFEMYQMLIKGQSDWDLYRPTVYTGNSWENY